jgi:hypothetical protein
MSLHLLPPAVPVPVGRDATILQLTDRYSELVDAMEAADVPPDVTEELDAIFWATWSLACGLSCDLAEARRCCR